MIRRWYIQEFLFGFLAMILSVIAAVVILLVVLLRSRHDVAIGPAYLLIPIAAFAAGFYWSLRRSARPRAPAVPSSKAMTVAKSAAVGIMATIVATIAWFIWIYARIPRTPGTFVAVDILSFLKRYWPLLAPVFVAGFLWEYWRVLRLRARVSGGPGS